MPRAPLRGCSYPGCSKLVVSGRCDQHTEDRVKAPWAWLYHTYAWKKASKNFLLEYPLCSTPACRARGVRSRVVDHKIPHRGDEQLFWDVGNWAPMCSPCHDSKTSKEIHTRRRAV